MSPTNAIQLPQIVNSSEQSDLRQLQFAQFLGYHFTRRNVNQSLDKFDLSISSLQHVKNLQLYKFTFFSRLKELSTDSSFFFCVQINFSSSIFHLVQLLALLYEMAIDDTCHRTLFLDLVMKSIKEKDSVEFANHIDAVERLYSGALQLRRDFRSIARSFHFERQRLCLDTSCTSETCRF